MKEEIPKSRWKADIEGIKEVFDYKQLFQKMSAHNNVSEQTKYANPLLPNREKLVFNYSSSKAMGFSHQQVSMNEMPNREDYPSKASHSRYPTMINCNSCNKLAMTDIEYEHGSASKVWCLLLIPFFCTGLCCFCLNSCKDVKHTCSECGADAGLNESAVC